MISGVLASALKAARSRNGSGLDSLRSRDRTTSGPKPDLGGAGQGGGSVGQVALGTITGANQVQAFQSFTGLGLLVRSADATYHARQLTLAAPASSLLSLSQAAGLEGNPTIGAPDAAANHLWAGPAAGPAAGAPSYRALVAADIDGLLPDLSGYLTEAEADMLYDPLGSAASALSNAQAYVDAALLDYLTQGAADGLYDALGSAASAQAAAEGYTDFELLGYSPTADFAAVAFSGAYADLSGLPTLGTMAAQAAADYPLASSLATVATSGQYGDLLGLPSLFSGAYGDLSGIPATFAPSAHAHAWADITSGKPTTLAGYGITDAQPLNSDLTAIAALTTAAFGRSLLEQANAGAARSTLAAAGSGAIGSAGLTMATARLLGRTTASAGAVEELAVGSSLSLAAGTLNTIQGLRTIDTPRFARLGVGVAAHASMLFDTPSASVSGFGPMLVGSLSSVPTWFYLGHRNQPHTDNYSVAVSPDGLNLINAPTGQSVQFRIGNIERVRLSSAGNLLVGTNSDSDLTGTGNIKALGILSTGDISIVRTAAAATFIANAASNTATESGMLQFSRARGTQAVPTAVANGDWLGVVTVAAYHGSGYAFPVNVVLTAAENFGANRGTAILFNSTRTGTATRVEAARISGAGNLLVGTNLDTGLTGAGNIKAPGIGMFGVAVLGSHGDNLALSHTDLNRNTEYALIGTNFGFTILNCSSGRDIRFRANNVDMGAWLSNGRLGIGTTSPARRFQVTDSAPAFMCVNTTGATTSGMLLGAEGSLNRIYSRDSPTSEAARPFAIVIGAAEALRITTDNRVGIGVAAPFYKLQVQDTGNVYICANRTNTNASAILLGAEDGVASIYSRAGPASATAIPLRFMFGSTERMRMSTGGVLSIGTTSDGSLPAGSLNLFNDLKCGRITSTNIQCSTIKTLPTVSHPTPTEWELGGYSALATTPTGLITVRIDGNEYEIPAREL